jgi:hypothetical protein
MDGVRYAPRVVKQATEIQPLVFLFGNRIDVGATIT